VQSAPTAHSPRVPADAPLRFRRHSFQYVTPSQPQIGGPVSSQSTGRSWQPPVGASHELFSQSSFGAQSAFDVQEAPGGLTGGSSDASTISATMTSFAEQPVAIAIAIVIVIARAGAIARVMAAPPSR
jgi:hypothetical protein